MENKRELLEKLIINSGYEIGIDTKICIIHKLEHKNCKGCETELGCMKLTRLMLTSLIPMIYSTKNYDDFARMQNRIAELTKKILASKTVDEIETIPDF